MIQGQGQVPMELLLIKIQHYYSLAFVNNAPIRLTQQGVRIHSENYQLQYHCTQPMDSLYIQPEKHLDQSLV